MRSPRNALRLIQAMEDAKAGRLTERELIEVEDEDDEAEIATRTDAGEPVSENRGLSMIMRKN
jgi:hypothetical protein